MTRTVRNALSAIFVTFTLILAACTQTPPVVNGPLITVLSPSAGATLSEYASVVLDAVAIDAEDGDISDSVTWESSLDGDLSPDSEGRVSLTAGAHVLTASVTDSSGNPASEDVSVTVQTPTDLRIVSAGRTLTVVGVIGEELVGGDSAEVPGEGLLPSHKIFNAIYHPDEPWLYVASMDSDWGNARIDRFAVGDHTIDYLGPAFVYEANLPGIDCTSAGVFEGIVGNCAPVGMVFSPDRTRLYVDDDDFDTLQIFSVAEDGSLEFIVEGASTSVHGLAIDPTGTYVYNGTNVIDVTNDVPTTAFVGNGGNSTAIVDLGGVPGLITTRSSGAIAVYDITDPVAPSLLAEEVLVENKVRELAYDVALERFYTVGRNSVGAFSFDGADFVALDEYVPDPLGSEYRHLSLSEAGDRLHAAWFHMAGGSGVDLFDVAEDGALTFVDRLEFDNGIGHIVVRMPQN